MIIMLPTKFQYEYKKEIKNNRKNCKKKNKNKKNKNMNKPYDDQSDNKKYIKEKAYVEKGILKIQKGMPFRKLMYAIALELNGEKCYYCGKKLSREEITMDHLYPQILGGPTIPNNLVPSCSKCNLQKADTNEEQYKKLKELSSKEKAKFMKRIEEYHEQVRRNDGIDIPKDWYEFMSIDFMTMINFTNVDIIEAKYSKDYQRIERQYRTYGTFKYPIIVDKNNKILYGEIMFIFCKAYFLQVVPTIKLENVEIV